MAQAQIADLGDLHAIVNAVLINQAAHHRRWLCPSDAYIPHEIEFRGKYEGLPSGQLQFHQSLHPFRLIAAGNGWGGTMACAIEVDAWMRHTNKWQNTPKGPVQGVWYAPDGAQFGELLETMLIPKCWGADVTYTEAGRLGPRVIWPEQHGGGGTLFVHTYGVKWTARQGTEPQLVVFDESPPIGLFKEMQQRRRGSDIAKKTRYVCKATQTEGLTFLNDMVYEPWLAYHAERGLTEEEAIEAQLHPFYWVWPRGGVHSNPNNDQQTIEESEARIWSSDAEKETRLYGGFRSFVGSPVFSEKALARMLEWAIEQERLDPPAIGSLFCSQEATK